MCLAVQIFLTTPVSRFIFSDISNISKRINLDLSMCKTRVQAKCLDGQLLISIYLFAAMHYYGNPHCITKADASLRSHDLSSVLTMPSLGLIESSSKRWGVNVKM